MSPPYRCREELKQIEITLSLACMIKVASPSARQGKIIPGIRRKFSFRIRIKLFLPHKNATTQIQDSACEMIVASAAPRTSICSPKIKIGSRMILLTAPINTEYIPVFANPCAVINAFMPRVSSTNIVPIA